MDANHTNPAAKVEVHTLGDIQKLLGGNQLLENLLQKWNSLNSEQIKTIILESDGIIKFINAFKDNTLFRDIHEYRNASKESLQNRLDAMDRILNAAIVSAEAEHTQVSQARKSMGKGKLPAELNLNADFKALFTMKIPP